MPLAFCPYLLLRRYTDNLEGRTFVKAFSNSAKKFARVLAFLAVFVLLCGMAQTILTRRPTVSDPKTGIWRHDFRTEPTLSSTITEYRAEPEQSIDVLFFGSSHVYCAVDPVLLWQEQGISSFSISSSNQNFDASLYMLKEALRTQTPKLVCIDMYSLLPDATYGMLPSSWQTLMSLWPLSFNTWQTAREKAGGEYTTLDLALPLVGYHTRWSELTRNDYTPTRDGEGRKGYLPRYNLYPMEFSMEPINDSPLADTAALDEIIALCKEKGIDVLLWKIPAGNWDSVYAETARQYAEAHDVPMLDLCENIDDLQIDYAQDFNDYWHLNANGAKRLTAYLGDYLKQQYTLPDRRSDAALAARWEAAATLAAHDAMSHTLESCDDFSEYVSLLEQGDYVVVYSMTAASWTPHPENISLVRDIEAISTFGADGYAGLAVTDGEDLLFREVSVDHDIYYSATLRGVDFAIKTAVAEAALTNIKIDGTRIPLSAMPGLHIVVYDPVLGCVTDAVTFDILNDGAAYRV